MPPRVSAKARWRHWSSSMSTAPWVASASSWANAFRPPPPPSRRAAVSLKAASSSAVITLRGSVLSQLRPGTRLPHARYHFAQLLGKQHVDHVVDGDDALHASFGIDHRYGHEIIARDGGCDFIAFGLDVDRDDV